MSIALPPEAAIDGKQRLPRIGGDWPFRVCLVILALFVLCAAIGPWIVPVDPTAIDLGNTMSGPSSSHLLGTTITGQDTLSLVIAGARTSLLGPLAIVVLSTLAGILIGLLAGWRGGWVDTVTSRALDVLFAFPGLLLAILAVAMFGKGLVAPVIAMAIAYMPYVARVTRSLVAAERVRPYVSAYELQGFSAPFVALRRVTPNILPTVSAQATVNFGYALLDLAALTYVGLGVQPPTPDWGAMINSGQESMVAGDPLPALVPIIALVLVVIAFTVVGEDLGERVAGRSS
jgi:peptide/nickel transport system permease protein